jgi:regulatory protein
MTLIRSIKFKRGTAQIELDDGESVVLPVAAALTYRLSQGVEISPLDLMEIKSESNRYMCGRKAMDFLAMRNRTEHELRRYLSKKGFSADDIDICVKSLRDAGYIDDLKYGSSYVIRRSERGIGKNRLRQELAGKGISRKTIAESLKAAPTDDESLDAATKIAEKKMKSIKNTANLRAKLANHLLSRGYGRDIIYRVIESLKDDINYMEKDNSHDVQFDE